MNQALFETLQTLRDIKGIQGSFILRFESGQVIGRDLPAIIDDTILAQVGPRIDRLFDVVESDPPTESIAMRFGDQRLDIRRMGPIHLCVLSEASISPPALRMAIKLVCRKLQAQDWGSPPEGVHPTSESSGTMEKARKIIQYRGTRTTI